MFEEGAAATAEDDATEADTDAAPAAEEAEGEAKED
jgi:hypothetical protein